MSSSVVTVSSANNNVEVVKGKLTAMARYNRDNALILARNI
jgi:hypothetical protein